MKANRWNPSSEQDRFWMKVDIRGPDECWPWLAGVTSSGYGRFRAEYGSTWAHKRALEFKIGRRLLPGKETLHSCDFRLCCNPAHLSEDSKSENFKDMWDKGRAKPGGLARNRNGKGHRGSLC